MCCIGHIYRFRWLIILLCWIVTTSCSSSRLTPVIQPMTELAIPTRAPITSTQDVESVPGATATNGTTIAAPGTPTPRPRTATPSVTPQLTPTFVPTLSTENEVAETLELLHTNGDCRLPCWWGFTPGVTQVQSLISWFHGATARGNARTSVRNMSILISLTWSHEEVTSAAVRVLTVEYCVFDDNDCYGQNPLYTEPTYPSLPHLLTTYGPPTQAYIGYEVGNREMGIGGDLFFLFLDYAEAGWKVTYQMELDSSLPVYTGCIDHAKATLKLWSPDDAQTANELRFPDPPVLKTVEQATGMTLTEFYETFRNPANQPCLSSPPDLYGP